MIKHPNFTIAPEVRIALDLGTPIVALESTVITHGLPRPQNLELARDMERTVRDIWRDSRDHCPAGWKNPHRTLGRGIGSAF